MAAVLVIQFVIQQSGDFRDWMICVTEWNPGAQAQTEYGFYTTHGQKTQGRRGKREL